MPAASPQVFGDQTDVPESGDWRNSSYLMIWGTNLPTTRTADAHFMTGARCRGQKVVVSPNYTARQVKRQGRAWIPLCASFAGVASSRGSVIRLARPDTRKVADLDRGIWQGLPTAYRDAQQVCGQRRRRPGHGVRHISGHIKHGPDVGRSRVDAQLGADRLGPAFQRAHRVAPIDNAFRVPLRPGSLEATACCMRAGPVRRVPGLFMGRRLRSATAR